MTESEKLTININTVDLGQIDLLVEQGLYSNRSDFIRTAMRNQLGEHSDVVKQTCSRRAIGMGALIYDRRTLEAVREAGDAIDIRWIGLTAIADDVPAQLASDTIRSLEVYGVFRAPEAVRQALAGRMSPR
jgi:Arc/MetJ-type ribon-helix-helix transcriptional regulator